MISSNHSILYLHAWKTNSNCFNFYSILFYLGMVKYTYKLVFQHKLRRPRMSRPIHKRLVQLSQNVNAHGPWIELIIEGISSWSFLTLINASNNCFVSDSSSFNRLPKPEKICPFHCNTEPVFLSTNGWNEAFKPRSISKELNNVNCIFGPFSSNWWSRINLLKKSGPRRDRKCWIVSFFNI